MKQEKPTIDLHYSRNSHHPEFYGTDVRPEPPDTEQRVTIATGRFLADRMTWLDIIEMVCDWRGAYLGYGSQGTWDENLVRQRERYAGWFTPEQWWLVEQVAAFVEVQKGRVA